jgi:hypothetical protein
VVQDTLKYRARRGAKLLWIISPTMVNEFRMNFTRFNFNQIATSGDVDFGIPRIEIEGYSFDRIRFGAPTSCRPPRQYLSRILMISAIPCR